MNFKCRKVVTGKNILLFKEMLADIGYDDPSVIDILVQGIKIVGEAEVTGIWERSDDKGARCDVKRMGAWKGISEGCSPKSKSDRPRVIRFCLGKYSQRS